MQRLTTAVVLLLSLAPVYARADWRSDEAYARKLQQRVAELRQAVQLFGRYRRTLDLVEGDINDVQLGLAAPGAKPDQLARRLLKQSYPGVRLQMDARRSQAPQGVSVWSWRCQLSGELGALRWATQLLRQKGLFILPQAREPVTLTVGRHGAQSSLKFTGHHVRLKQLTPPPAPPPPSGGDIFATRTDPVARRIKRLRAELSKLRLQVANIQGFEARVSAIRQYLKLLADLTRRSTDPFVAITPLLDLDLVRLRRVVHQGRSVTLHGALLSPDARPLVRRWLARQSRRSRVRYALVTPRVAGREPAPAASKPQQRTGCSGWADEARADDLALALALGHGPVVVLQPGDTPAATLSGAHDGKRCNQTLDAMVSSLGLVQLRGPAGLLLLPTGRASAAVKRLVAAHGRRWGRRLAAHWLRRTTSSALQQISGASHGRAVEVPVGALAGEDRLSLYGSTRTSAWLQLVGAALGLRPARGKQHDRLVPADDKAARQPTRLLRQQQQHGDARSLATRYGLGQLRLRLLVRPARSPGFAVLSGPDGRPFRVRRGSLLGRSRAQVVRLHSGGVTLLWSSGRTSGRVTLPLRRQPTAGAQAPPGG